MRIPLLGILGLLAVGMATAEVDTPEVSTDLLSTLQVLNQTIAIQIADLHKMETTEERKHLIQHYSAQKNNIEREIALIQSIQDTSHTDTTSPRHILKKLSGEEKTIPSFLNIFKKPQNPNNEQSSSNVAYSLPYPFHYPGYGEDYTYPYYGPSINSEFQYPNDLVQGTFPGHRPDPNNEQMYPTNDLIHDTFPGHPPRPADHKPQQLFTTAYQSSPTTEIITLPGLRSSTPRPQVQPPKLEPQRQFEQSYRPQPDPSRPLPGVGAQNQIPLGQHHGVFVYYPNGVTNDEGGEDERITIASRFGQAIDRVGQVISNLANRQTVRSPEYGDDGTVTQFSEQLPSRYRVRSNRPRSLPGGTKLTLIEQQNGYV